MKENLFKNWHTMRWVALAVGVFLATMAILHNDLLTGFFSAFFIFQAVTNSGCMVAQTCGVPGSNTQMTDEEKEIEFTEIT